MSSDPKNIFTVRVSHTLPDFELDVDLCLPTRGVTAFFGPSGSGKTSLLRTIAGLDKTSPQNSIKFKGQEWQAGKKFCPPHKRHIGYIFQESSLFDHLSVQQNLDYGLKRSTNPMSLTEQNQIYDLLGITHLLNRKPEKLSGGERQRVAIARALLPKPDLLLMDEPMASLDNDRKDDILNFLEMLKSNIDIPLLYVSHNTDEVTRLADHMVIMDHGKIQAQGPAHTILSDHKIINRMSPEPFTLLFSRIKTPETGHHLTEVDIGGDLIRIPLPPMTRNQEMNKGQEIRLQVFARDVSLALSKPEKTSILNILKCHIESIEPPTPDGQCLIHLALKGASLQARVSQFSCIELGLKVGQNIFAQIKAVSIVR